MPDDTPHIGLLEFGRVPYGQALALQFELRRRLLEGDAPEDRAGYVICLEHPPVVTIGKRGGRADLLARERLIELGAEVFAIDRGGEATLHNPGQLVVYPVVELEALGLGVVDLVRGVAGAIADAAADFDVSADYDTDHPGVWTDETPPRKLASVGMRVRRGVSTHGAALNLVNDLRPFSMIVPCGMPDAPMARLADYVDDEAPLEPAAFRSRLYDDLESLTGASLRPLDVELPEPSEWVEPTDFPLE